MSDHRIYVAYTEDEVPRTHYAWCSCGWRSGTGMDDKQALWEGWNHQTQADIGAVINEEKT